MAAAGPDMELMEMFSSVPIQRDAAYEAVKPSNQISYWSFVVPVLPPAAAPLTAAEPAIPRVITVWSTFLMMKATPSLRASDCSDLPSSITLPSRSSTL